MASSRKLKRLKREKGLGSKSTTKTTKRQNEVEIPLMMSHNQLPKSMWNRKKRGIPKLSSARSEHT